MMFVGWLKSVSSIVTSMQLHLWGKIGKILCILWIGIQKKAMKKVENFQFSTDGAQNT